LGCWTSSAKQNKRFLLFLEKEENRRVLLGARPRAPWVGVAEGWAAKRLLRSRTNAFCFFFWKKKKDGHASDDVKDTNSVIYSSLNQIKVVRSRDVSSWVRVVLLIYEE
jgi:hypothetical protein